MASPISANKALSTYSLFNATDIKSFIIKQLKESDNPNNPVFKDANYLGSNLNAFIDIIAVMLQQILFNLSVNSSETTFSSAVLYENMSKLVSILDYKPIGKQTSMLPVTIEVDLKNVNNGEVNQYVLPRFLTANYNDNYILENDIISYPGLDNKLYINTVLHQGNIQEVKFDALGDDFETFILKDTYISNSSKFISDNFFSVFVRTKNGKTWNKWEEWHQTNSLFLENKNSKKYEKRFNENFNYEFKFGNGTFGKKLPKDAQIAIFYLLSSGERAQIGENTFTNVTPKEYQSALYNQIKRDLNDTINYRSAASIKVSNTGPSTAISYPESVASMRTNAPKIFASQNRLFSLEDYKTFIMNMFSAYCKDIFMMNNNDYISKFLKYYYDLGIDRPQNDSRLNIAQVEFMTANNFNNIYAFLLPKINTIIDGKIPNYINTSLKQQIVNKTESFKGITHNLVLLDPIYKAFTWGSPYIDYSYPNNDQLKNKLYIVRNSVSNYSVNYIKNNVLNNLLVYFKSLTLGSTIDINTISQCIKSVPGIESVYIKDTEGNKIKNISLLVWNPLYKTEDCVLYQQNVLNENFVYPFFYDINNLSNSIVVIENKNEND